MTVEEMQAMSERKRKYETGETGTFVSDTSYVRERHTGNGYTSQGSSPYARRGEGYSGDEESRQSYRERYRAEHRNIAREGNEERFRNTPYRAQRRSYDHGGNNDRRDDGRGDSEYSARPRRNGEREGGYRSAGLRKGPGKEGYAPKGGPKMRRDDKQAGGAFPKKGQKPFGKKPGQKIVRERPKYNFDNEETNPETSIRLNKFLAHAGVASRREADQLILAGAVLVNGTPVLELGTKVLTTDRVEVNGKVLSAEQKVYVLLNKPRNVVTTTDDPQERMTVLNLVRNAATERIYPVGRLDRNTTGVLLLTNDGDLASKLVHPSFKKKKIYQVWLDKEVAPEDMQKLADGVELSDGEMHADAVSYVDEEDHTQVGIEIHSGKNRVVRRLFEALGYRVIKLDRVYFAGLTKKNLGRGKWRYLTEQEVINLKNNFFE